MSYMIGIDKQEIEHPFLGSIQSHYQESIEKQRNKSLNFVLKTIDDNKLAHDINKTSTALTLHNLLFNSLRSKVFPSNKIEKFSDEFYQVFIAQNKKLELYCILTEQTVLNELNYFINFIKLYNKFDSLIKVYFLLVEWPLVKDNFNSRPNSGLLSTYHTVVAHLAASINFAKLYFLSPYNLPAVSTVLVDPLFAQEFQKSIQLVHSYDSLASNSRLAMDVKWIIDFYKRQDSFRKLKCGQAIFDLAMRRSIGSYLAKKFDNNLGEKNKSCYLITSELNKRFLPCYNTQQMIINIKTS